jgi:hypothetical protein
MHRIFDHLNKTAIRLTSALAHRRLDNNANSHSWQVSTKYALGSAVVAGTLFAFNRRTSDEGECSGSFPEWLGRVIGESS